jgi:isopropylmalate/homocitrate/citramalate synthase
LAIVSPKWWLKRSQYVSRSGGTEVIRLMEAVLDVGADRVCLADTVGYADL